MKYDDVLSQLGDFGKYQKIAYFAICLPLMFEGMQILSPVFILAVPNHRCAIPGLVNDTYDIQSEAHRELINTYIPVKEDGEYAKCTYYVHDVTTGADNETSRAIAKCEKWVYDTTYFLDTVVTELDIVCARTINRAHATVSMNIGAMFSFIALGTVADRYGRKKATFCELILMGLFSCLIIWLPNIYVFIVIRLFIGIGFGVFYNSCYIYAMEVVGPSKRTLCGMLQNFFWAAGILIQAALAYYIRSWRALQLAISVPVFGVLLYWWYLPDSGRWLMSKGRKQQCQTIFIRMTEVNKKDVDLDLLSMQLEETYSETKEQSILSIFKSRTLTVRSLIVFWNWFTINLLYLGLSLNVGNLSGNIYANFALSCVMEVIGYSLCFPGLHWFGRKRFHCITMLTGGFVLLITIIPEVYGTKDLQWMVVLLAMVGKMVSSAGYASIYLYSAELFPTVLRNITMGVCSLCATVGGITAPYIVELVNIIPISSAAIMPLIVFGVTSLSAGILALMLPETRNSQLPDTIEDMKLQQQNNIRPSDLPLNPTCSLVESLHTKTNDETDKII